MEGWILEIPKWKGQMFFTSDMVLLLMMIGIMLSGIVLCFLGYQYFQTIILSMTGCASGILGISLAEELLVESIYKMIFFVMFTFFGVFCLYFVTSLVRNVLRKLKIYNSLMNKLYLISPLLGSIMVMFLIYFYVYHNLIIAMGIFLIFFIFGFLYSKKRVASRKPFYSYYDLCQLKPLKDVKKNA